MYQQGTARNYQNNEEFAFEYLNRKFAGRGLAAQARASAESYGREGMYGYRGASSSPLTLSEFEHNYRRRTGVTAMTSSNINNVSLASHARKANSEERRPMPERRVQKGAVNNVSAASNRAAQITENRQPQRTVPQPHRRTQVAPQRVKTDVLPSRRVVKTDKDESFSFARIFGNTFRNLPVGALMTVMICAVSLMFIVGSSVLLNDASDDYVGIQDEISQLAKKEEELLVALEVKNDLRSIENIAVNKLGMVKKDLVTRQYIKLSDEDVIETYEDENKNVGLSTILAAIMGGK
ncbi:MAG: hypothetical protein U0M06_14075 [Clostridia bacterium]|nr:hypothetical protein [Clostridia bacterium]